MHDTIPHTEPHPRPTDIDETTVSVSVQDIKKTFSQHAFSLRTFVTRRKVEAVRGISFDLHPGEMVGLLGPNGAGKTTLLKMMSTLIYPSDGCIRFFGEDVRTDEIASRGMLGFITCDERSFYWRLTGRANLQFFADLYGITPRESGRKITSLLDALDLSHAADQRFDTYSSGMKQKLAIARGLLKDPRIVLYDEPTRSLDPLSQHNVRHLIQENRRRCPEQTHLLATHNLVEAEQLCDRIIIIVKGRIVAHGTVDEVREYFKKENSFHVLVVSSPKDDYVTSLAALDDVIHVEALGITETTQTLRITADTAGEGLSRSLVHIIQSGARILQCDTEIVSLDEIFRAVSQPASDENTALGQGA